MKKIQNIIKEKWNIILLLGMFFVILAFPLSGFFISDNTENIENKTLQEKPSFNITTWNEYPRLFESYFNDTIPYKKQFVSLYNQFIWYVFDESPANYVIKGKDGWLFYDSKNRNDYDELGDYRGTTMLTEYELNTIVKRLVSAKKLCDEIGAEFYVMVGPNKTEIYGDDYLPDAYRRKSESSNIVNQLSNALNEKTDITLIYPKEEFLQQKDEKQLYLKLDTHWNNYGAYVAYTKFMEKYKPDEDISINSMEIYPKKSGDLAAMIQMNDLDDSDYVVEFRPDITVQVLEDQPATATDVAKYRTNSSCEDGSKLLMYRDSFTNALAPYMSKTFTDAYFKWTSSMDEEEIRREQPDVVVLEIVERGIKSLAYIKWNIGNEFAASISQDFSTMMVQYTDDFGMINDNKVWFAVWSQENGQDDLHWYEAQLAGEGVWQYEVDLKQHNTVGDYAIHVYTGNSEPTQFIAEKNVYVAELAQ